MDWTDEHRFDKIVQDPKKPMFLMIQWRDSQNNEQTEAIGSFVNRLRTAFANKTPLNPEMQKAYDAMNMFDGLNL